MLVEGLRGCSERGAARAMIRRAYALAGVPVCALAHPGANRGCFPQAYELRDARNDFRHNVQRTDLPVGVESRVVNASLPANRSAEPWRDLFDFRGAPSAVRRFLREARAADATLPTREVPWRRVSVVMSVFGDFLTRRQSAGLHNATAARGRSPCAAVPSSRFLNPRTIAQDHTKFTDQ